MKIRKYGNYWQELRALIATKLIALALFVHFWATLDLAEDLTELKHGS